MINMINEQLFIYHVYHNTFWIIDGNQKIFHAVAWHWASNKKASSSSLLSLVNGAVSESIIKMSTTGITCIMRLSNHALTRHNGLLHAYGQGPQTYNWVRRIQILKYMYLYWYIILETASYASGFFNLNLITHIPKYSFFPSKLNSFLRVIISNRTRQIWGIW